VDRGISQTKPQGSFTFRSRMELNAAIEVINGSDRSSDEKKHLRKLVSNGGLLPARFAGTPNFDEILDDFPVLG
jgi:hypothetical protein